MSYSHSLNDIECRLTVQVTKPFRKLPLALFACFNNRWKGDTLRSAFLRLPRAHQPSVPLELCEPLEGCYSLLFCFFYVGYNSISCFTNLNLYAPFVIHCNNCQTVRNVGGTLVWVFEVFRWSVLMTDVRPTFYIVNKYTEAVNSPIIHDEKKKKISISQWGLQKHSFYCRNLSQGRKTVRVWRA